MTTQLVENIIRRADFMVSERSVFDSHWGEVRRVINPDGTPFQQTSTPGAKTHHEVLDNTGEMASETFAAGAMGLMYDPARKWFGIRAENERINEDRDASIWLEDTAKRMRAMFTTPRARFATSQGQKLRSYGDYGTGSMFVGEKAGFGAIFHTRPLAEMLLAENDEGVVDTVYRDFKLPARKAVEEFGDAAGKKVVSDATKVETERKESRFVHAVQPREDRVLGKINGPNRPFTDIVINVDEKHLVRNSGYFEQPWITPRLAPRESETYGRGRGMVALADVKMLQRTFRVTVRGGEKIIDPPLNVPHDGMFSPVALTPGALNFVRADLLNRKAGPQPILTGGRPDFGEDMMAGIRQRIDNAYWKQVMQRFRDPRMTATQVLKEEEEALRFMGPMLAWLEQEDGGPMIKRVFAVMFRLKMFLPMPSILERERLEIEFVSPVAKAQRLSEVAAIDQTAQIIAPWSAANPEIFDNFDTDDIARVAGEVTDLPKTSIRAPEAVEEIRRARAEAQAAEVEKQDALATAQAAGQVLPGLAAVSDQLPTDPAAGVDAEPDEFDQEVAA